MAITQSDGSVIEDFNSLDSSFWYVSDFTMQDSWQQTAWEADNIVFSDGLMTMELNNIDRDGKEYTGSEIQSNDTFGYGTYTVQMQASGEAGVNSNFFTYTGPYFGNETNEIDIEILGSDPTQVWLAYHVAEGSHSVTVDLGFDASLDIHEYSFVWEPNSISWYVDGVLVYEVVNPDLEVPDTPSKMYMNLWAGLPEWMGTTTFTDATTSVYDQVTFTPWDGVYTYSLPGSSDLGPIVTVDDTATTEAGTPVLIDVLANDSDAEGDPLSVLLPSSESAAGGTLAVQNGEVLYTPADGFDGTDSFDYLAIDATGESATGSVSITVDAAEPPSPPPPPSEGSAFDLFLVEITGRKTWQVVQQIEDGDVIDAALIDSDQFALVAETTDSVSLHKRSTIEFDLSGAVVHTETDKSEPYAVLGESRGGLDGMDLPTGSYDLLIAAYDGGDQTAVVTASFHFEIADLDLLI